jgi:hypothetical protein
VVLTSNTIVLGRARVLIGCEATGDIAESDLSESMLLDYIRFQSTQDPRPSGATINTPVPTADPALRNEFPDAPCQIAHGFHQYFLYRRPMGLGRPRVAVSRLRVKEAARGPASIEGERYRLTLCRASISNRRTA